METHLTWSFLVTGALTIVAAVAAVSLRNLVHCALALAGAFAGLAVLYLQLNAQFVGFAQILIYVGAVAILIVFAILLTRAAESQARQIFSKSWLAGLLVAVLVFGVLGGVIVSSKAVARVAGREPNATVRELGTQLMSQFILPLEALGLLLTAALIGAVLIGLAERRSE